MADDFCKLYDRFIKANGLAPKRDKSKRKYHRDSRMSSAEIITIMILFHLSGYKCFKHFYINEVQEHMTDIFPKTVAYNRFTELERTVVIPFILFVKRCCMGKCTGISFVDSTLLRVCRNQRIHMHKVFKGIAQRGQCSMGWFYGFKLHLICNEMGELLSFMVTPGNVDDREPLKNKTFVEQLFGKLVGDKGYISKDIFSKLFVDGIQLITKLRNNMKGQIMTLSDKILLRKRAIIETINDELKNIAQIEHSRHRSVTGFTVNLMAGLAAYSFFPKKPMIAVERVDPEENGLIQLSLFLVIIHRTHVNIKQYEAIARAKEFDDEQVFKMKNSIGLPDLIVIKEMDNDMLIDFNTEDGRRLFWKMFRQHRVLKVEEFTYDDEQSVITSADGKFCGEFVLSFVKDVSYGEA